MNRCVVVLACVLLGACVSSWGLEFEAGDALVKPMLGGGTLSKAGQQVADVVRVHEAGVYTLGVRAHGSPAGEQWPRMSVDVDGLAQGMATVNTEEPKDYSFEVDMEPGVYTVGAGLLNESEGFLKAQKLRLGTISITAPAGGKDPEKAAPGDWVEDAKAREAKVLAASEAGIRAHRMGKAVVRVVDAAGNPVAGAKVTAAQEKHAFLFGANLFGWSKFPAMDKQELFKVRFREVFNYATLPFYWPVFEPAKGRTNYREVERMASWCDYHGIRAKGHPLLWHSEFGLPKWADGTPSAELQQAHVTETMERFKRKVRAWDVLNEPANEPGFALKAPFDWARKTDPEAELILNEFGQFYNGHPVFFEMVKQAIEDGAEIDAIGIQAHAPINMAWPLDKVWTVLDRYGALGKAIHITEFMVGDNGAKVDGAVWRGRWSAEQQAAFAEEFYRVCFSHPAVTAITWWDLCEIDAWFPGGGLLREDLSPKPAYEGLKKLIQEEWKTAAAGESGEDGAFAFDGFLGEYAVAVEHDGKRAEIVLALPRTGADVRVILP